MAPQRGDLRAKDSDLHAGRAHRCEAHGLFEGERLSARGERNDCQRENREALHRGRRVISASVLGWSDPSGLGMVTTTAADRDSVLPCRGMTESISSANVRTGTLN